MDLDQKLVITEIYASLQGESSFAGLPCVFIRLTGCPLRCRWCDTAYGFDGGTKMSLQEILDKVDSLKIPLVELTGGEPLSQALCPELAARLIERGYKVLIETSGSEDISVLPAAVHVIMDLKPPGSKMDHKNLWTNLSHLKKSDEIKFVISDRHDFDWSLEKIKAHGLEDLCHLLMSPAFGLLQPKQLAEWILESGLTVRLNLQQHKYIWHPRARGV